MEDEEVIQILMDLDAGDSLERADLKQLFDVFDVVRDGSVTVLELMDTLLKLRGSPQKRDMVASWVALQHLMNLFKDFQSSTLITLDQLVECQSSQVTDLTPAGVPVPPPRITNPPSPDSTGCQRPRKSSLGSEASVAWS